TFGFRSLNWNGRWHFCPFITKIKINELVKLFHKSKFYSTSWAITLFSKNNFYVLLFLFIVIIIISIKKSNDISILLNTPGFPKIRHHRSLILSRFYTTG